MVDIDTAVGGTGSESELALGEMVAASVGSCVELSEVLTESCFSTLRDEERWKEQIIGVASGKPFSEDSSERCMQVWSGVDAGNDGTSGAVEGVMVLRTA